MPDYREIVTKSIIGKGKKYYKTAHTIAPANQPSSVLGCWVINHSYSAFDRNDTCVIRGQYDVNVWYSYDNDSKTDVITKTVEFEEELKVPYNLEEALGTNKDIIIRPLTQPNVTNAKIDNGEIVFDVEKEFGVELIGDTKLRVSVERLVDNWPALDDIDNINTDFLK